MDDLTTTTSRLQPDRFTASRRKPRNRARFAVLLIFLISAAGATTYWYLTKDYVTTDDAFTDGNAITVAPQIAGEVTTLNVTDNQYVTLGQLLLQIDPRPYQAARDQAAASLQAAQANLADARLKLDTARIIYPARLAAAQAQRDAAKATLAKAEADYRRQLALPRSATTQQAIDAATAARLDAEAQVEQTEAAVEQADTVDEDIAQAEATVRDMQAKVALAQAALEQANLNLTWTRIMAPEDGWITKRNVNPGDYAQPGQSLFAIVIPGVWVTANFKETDLNYIHPGQKVTITADAYPKLHLRGHVDSIQFGSGERFTAFPPENATGNFVKVVQRVPVKILIDSGIDKDHPLPLGISVEPTIRIDQ
ncbi:MAG: HlyD family secretion protein [Acetobacteraceae bacterium]|nr:HlyD family secretion protein [Acetobacteraceae bacterium]